MGIGRVFATGAVVVAGLGVLGACGWDITKEKATDKVGITDEFSSVRFANDSGNIEITTGDQPSVTRVIHYEDEQPDATHRVENGALILEPCPLRDCWIDYEVVVPDGVTVDGKVDSGNAEISDVAGVNLEVDSGHAKIRDVDGAVNVDADSGNVVLDGISGTAQVQADSGNVKVTLAVPEDVRVRASSGNIEVTVPQAPYRVDTSVESGNVNSDVPDDDGAGHQLHLAADSGNITVKVA